MAEIVGEDADGTSFRVPATLEDTSASGACIRVRRPLAIGTRITVKWQREQFAAVAKNCRSDGRDFLLGVRRENERSIAARVDDAPASRPERASLAKKADREMPHEPPSDQAFTRIPCEKPPAIPLLSPAMLPHLRQENPTEDTSPRPERKVMESKTVFPHFWRRKQDEDASTRLGTMEAPMNKLTQEQTPSGPRGELLNYEDIYRAAGILSPGSGYGIHKVVDMLNNDRIRDLSKEVKRSSVLMALDAAGISADELLTDATRRQNALTAYEAAQVKQLDEFETRKGKENAKIEEELEKIRTHYGERVQANLDLVAKEKEALRNWQAAMQHETQRIAEVIELCGKQAAPSCDKAMAAAAGGQSSTKSEPADSAPVAALRPTLLGKN